MVIFGQEQIYKFVYDISIFLVFVIFTYLFASVSKILINTSMKSKGIKVKIHVLTGSPSESIISLAGEENVSLIIISTLGKGMFRELLLGGTARDVVRRTNRS